MLDSYEPDEMEDITSVTFEIKQYAVTSLVWLWRQFTTLISSLISLACLLRHLNFLPHLSRALGRILRSESQVITICPLESVVYPPPFHERFLNVFRSEQSRRRLLLAWIRKTIPDQNIEDFNCSWCSGIALCALAEATKPGACPRYDILMPDQAQNNCHLAMKLIRRSFGIFEPFEPSSMADPVSDNEDVLIPYLEMIRFASMVPQKIKSLKPQQTKEDAEGKIPDIQECLATGSGLVTAIVGRKAKINIAKPLFFKKKLIVEIKGPNSEHVRRSIEDLKSSDDLGGILSNSSRGGQRATGAITFDYQKIKDGQYQISYVPPSPGRYILSVLWGGEHTTSSPFVVNAVSNDAKASVKPSFKKSVSFSSTTDSGTNPSTPSTSSSLTGQTGSGRLRRHSLYRQSHLSSEQSNNFVSANSLADQPPGSFSTSRDSHTPSPNFSRGGSVLSSSTDRQGPPRARRRVVKRVVKCPNGKDEVYFPTSTERNTFDRSCDSSSLSMSLSVSYDDRFSSRSPSPSPVIIAPVPTLHTLERQIHMYADRCSDQILCSAFYEMSKEVVFAIAKRAPDDDTPELPPDGHKPSCSLEPSSTMNSSFTDGLSIQTDSIVDDVFESSRPTSCERKLVDEVPYDTLTPLEDSVTSYHRYGNALRRPRYDSETLFKPISYDPSEFPHSERSPKHRSRSDSDNLTSAESRNERDFIPSDSSCFRPVMTTWEDITDYDKTEELDFRTRHPKLKSRRKAHKSVEHQETQCSADEIKRVTGWMNRRKRLTSAHLMKEVESNDCPPPIEEMSASMNYSHQQRKQDTAFRTVENKHRNVGHKTANELGDHSIYRTSSEPASYTIDRPQVRPRSKSVARQSTFDSGYSDENGQSGVTNPPRIDNSSEKMDLESIRRLGEDMNSGRSVYKAELRGTIASSKDCDEMGTGNVIPVEERVDDNANNLDDTCSTSNHVVLGDIPDDPLANGSHPITSDLSEDAQPFAAYWEELIHHLENDPKFPVQEFISRVKNISMDIGTRNLIYDKPHRIRRCDELQGGIHDKANGSDEHVDDARRNVLGNLDSSPSGSPERETNVEGCRAQGWGLHGGRIGIKNNFQVCTEGAVDGSLAVSIKGPRRHAVMECSVVYTGDDLYEVLYDVSLAGFYAISIKWADRHILDSPFIVRVTF